MGRFAGPPDMVLFSPPSIDLPKPPIPYVPGWRFTVQSHVAPTPTPVTPGCCKNSRPSVAERNLTDPIERCLRYPPLPGEKGSYTIDLEIIGLLRVKDGTSAQVFTVQTCEARDGPEFFRQRRRKLVAKVYDPLYFDDDDAYLNPFFCVDRHYTHEVRAYEMLSEMLPEMQGKSIPNFYGSYSLELPVDDGGSRTRTVRLILIEYIPGISMQQTSPEKFSQSTRQEIMKSLIDFETSVYERANIMLTDLSPRNVMMAERSAKQPDVSKNLVFIDFAGAIFNRKYDHPLLEGKDMLCGQYISPLLRWKKLKAWDFMDWIDWDWPTWVEVEYAHTVSTITPEMRDRYKV